MTSQIEVPVLRFEVPARLLTLADWEGLGEDEGYRTEVVDGALLVSAQALPFHNKAIHRLMNLLESSVPRQVIPISEVEVLLAADPLTIRVPDVCLVHTAAYLANPPRFTAPDVVLAVEIVSPGSRRTDHGAKRYDYEQVGIPCYWILDLERRLTTCLELVDGSYREVLSQADDDPVTLPVPYPVTFSWNDLIRR